MQRQGFQQSAGIPLRAFLPQARDPRIGVFAHLDPEAAGDFGQLQAALGVVVRQFLERLADIGGRGAFIVGEYGFDVFHRQRFTGGQQDGLQDAFQRGSGGVTYARHAYSLFIRRPGRPIPGSSRKAAPMVRSE
jgi:hypothetical protein